MSRWSRTCRCLWQFCCRICSQDEFPNQLLFAFWSFIAALLLDDFVCWLGLKLSTCMKFRSFLDEDFEDTSTVYHHMTIIMTTADDDVRDRSECFLWYQCNKPFKTLCRRQHYFSKYFLYIVPYLSIAYSFNHVILACMRPGQSSWQLPFNYETRQLLIFHTFWTSYCLPPYILSDTSIDAVILSIKDWACLKPRESQAPPLHSSRSMSPLFFFLLGSNTLKSRRRSPPASM